jgi:histidinol-phosphate aminotransferase
VRTYPTHTYFFLADFAPHNAAELADQLRSRDILIKPLNDPALGPGFMRITTALPEDNRRFVAALRELLSSALSSPFEAHRRHYETWFGEHEVPLFRNFWIYAPGAANEQPHVDYALIAMRC